jgi:ferredoxin-type protein NapH
MKHIPTITRLAFLGLFLYLLISGKTVAWLGLFAFSLAAGLLFGRIYCGYACPMNTLMIPTAWLAKKWNLRRSAVPVYLKSGKWPLIFLITAVVTMIASKKFLSFEIPILPVFLVMSILTALWHGPYVFHNYICPFGLLQRLTGKYAQFTKCVDLENCISCRKCEKVCPSKAIIVRDNIGKATIMTELCHQCTNCQAACPKNAIHTARKNRYGSV